MMLFRKPNIGKPVLFKSVNSDLRLAACQGDLREVADLLKRGAKFIPDKDGRTALHLATASGHCSVIQMVIEHGCDINHKDKLGYTALHRACFDGFDEIVRLLLDANAKLDEQDIVQENTALHEAASRGHVKCIELLLKVKANVYIRNKTGATAFHLACQNGFSQPCKLLMQHGCKPNVKDKYDDTPLHTACRYLHISAAKVILSDSTSLNEQNKNGDTPLHLCTNLGHRKLSKLLLENGAAANIRNNQGETALDIATRKQQSGLADLFKSGPSKIGKQTDIKFDRRLKTKIRERLKLSQQDPDSTWKILFQDWPDDGISNQIQKGSLMNISEPKSNLQSNEILIDFVGPSPIRSSPRKVVPCNCAPFFYRLAKHADEAHRELLEEIDACHMNLNGEICDLRQITERKLTDLNNSIKMRLLRERANCTQRIKKHLVDPSAARRFGQKIGLNRCKSESEIETVERTHFSNVRKRLDSDESLFLQNGREWRNDIIERETPKGKRYNFPISRHRKSPANSRNVTANQQSRRPLRNDRIDNRANRDTNHRTDDSFDVRANKNRFLNETVREFDRLVVNTTSTTMDEDSAENFAESRRKELFAAKNISRNRPQDSLYSCQSNDSSSHHSPVRNSYEESNPLMIAAKIGDESGQCAPTLAHHRYQPPSVDSGYGTKPETLSSSPMHRLSFDASANSATASVGQPSPVTSLVNPRKTNSKIMFRNIVSIPMSSDLDERFKATPPGQSFANNSFHYETGSAKTRHFQNSSYKCEESVISRAKSEEYLFEGGDYSESANRESQGAEQYFTLGRFRSHKQHSIDQSSPFIRQRVSLVSKKGVKPEMSGNQKPEMTRLSRTKAMYDQSYDKVKNQSLSVLQHYRLAKDNRSAAMLTDLRISTASVSTDSSEISSYHGRMDRNNVETQTDHFESYSDCHEYTELEQLMKSSGCIARSAKLSSMQQANQNRDQTEIEGGQNSSPVLIIPPPPTKPLPPVPGKISKNLNTQRVVKYKFTTNV